MACLEDLLALDATAPIDLASCSLSAMQKGIQEDWHAGSRRLQK
jgi:hypothetical protein